MVDTQFIFLKADKTLIQNKNFIKISILEFKTLSIFHIYKPYSEEYFEKLLDTFTVFNDVSHCIDYVIKKDGRISLDILV